MGAPTANDKRRLFESHALFGRLSRDDLVTLLSHARVEHYPTGRQIFAKGSPGRSVMAVLSGSVKISAPSPGSKEIVFNIVKAGEIFGEIALLDGRERTADATALSDCDLLVIDRRDFMLLLKNRADFCIIILEILCHRLRQTSQQVEDTLFQPLESRIAKTLIGLAGNTDRRDANMSVHLHVSQQELGSMAGATRESINKHLRIWQRAGFLELGRRSIVVRDIAAIERLI